MDDVNLVSLITLVIGTILGVLITKGSFKDFARWLKDLIPGDHLEPLIGEVLIQIGTELKNGTITAKQAKEKLQSLFKIPL